MQTPQNTSVLITVSGHDSPGITSELTGILANSNSTILDIGQAVIHDLLSLSILFELAPETEDKALIKDLLFKATELDLKLEFRIFRPDEGTSSKDISPKAYHYVVTLTATPVTAQALHEVTAVLAKFHANIDTIERLNEGELGCIEMIVSSSEDLDRSALKEKLLSIAKKQEVDIALQAEGLYRRARRMIIFDKRFFPEIFIQGRPLLLNQNK